MATTNKTWTAGIHAAINKNAVYLSMMAAEAHDMAHLCLQQSGGEDDGGFSELADALYGLTDMAYDLGGCVEGGPCCHPMGNHDCIGFLEGSSGCAWNR